MTESTPKCKWAWAALQACIRQANPANLEIKLQDLYKYQMDFIKTIAQCAPTAKTPDATLRAMLQQLRDEGLLEFIKGRKGNYRLKPLQILVSELTARKKRSRGERLIAALLRHLGINYETEKTFKDLKDKSYLRFDFYFKVGDRRFVIEFDGQQHHRPVEFFGGEKAYLETVRRDQIKNEYCARNNIVMIRVNELNYDRVKQVVEQRIQEVLIEQPRLRSQVQ